MFVKIHLFISLSLLIAIITNAQKTTPFIFDLGFGDFVLGADKNSFGNTIRLVDTSLGRA